MSFNILKDNLILLSVYTKNPKKWEKWIKRLHNDNKLLYPAENGSQVIDSVETEIKEILNGFETTKYIDLKSGGWADGLKYAQNLVGNSVYRVWTSGGKHIVIPLRVLSIELNSDEIYLRVYSESKSSGKELIRKLSLKDYHKIWTCHRNTCEKLIGVNND